MKLHNPFCQTKPLGRVDDDVISQLNLSEDIPSARFNQTKSEIEKLKVLIFLSETCSINCKDFKRWYMSKCFYRITEF